MLNSYISYHDADFIHKSYHKVVVIGVECVGVNAFGSTISTVELLKCLNTGPHLSYVQFLTA